MFQLADFKKKDDAIVFIVAIAIGGLILLGIIAVVAFFAMQMVINNILPIAIAIFILFVLPKVIVSYRQSEDFRLSKRGNNR